MLVGTESRKQEGGAAKEETEGTGHASRPSDEGEGRVVSGQDLMDVG